MGKARKLTMKTTFRRRGIVLAAALVTKEVYSSLLAGCVMGALLAEGFAPWRSFETLFLTLMEGIDRKIFFFDVLLGAIVVLFARSGGSRAFGEWASRRVRSRRGAETATAGLGCLIFLDDYFNCLTVGAIMQPIADRFRISREKLAFLIDATAGVHHRAHQLLGRRRVVVHSGGIRRNGQRLHPVSAGHPV